MDSRRSNHSLALRVLLLVMCGNTKISLIARVMSTVVLAIRSVVGLAESEMHLEQCLPSGSQDSLSEQFALSFLLVEPLSVANALASDRAVRLQVWKELLPC